MNSKSAPVDGLLDELQSTLANGSVGRRIETLRRVTDLFLSGTIDYSDQQITLFDTLLERRGVYTQQAHLCLFTPILVK